MTVQQFIDELRVFPTLALRIQEEHNIHAVDDNGRNVIHYLVMEDRPQDIGAASRWGVDPSRGDRDGLTPLHLAAIRESEVAIRALIAAGAQVDAQDRWGNTPLSRAVFEYEGGGGNCIIALLRAGANPDLNNSTGISPRALAFKIASTSVRRFFRPTGGEV